MESGENQPVSGHPVARRPASSLRGPRPRLVSLFTGIGGMDLGLERAGFRAVAQVEADPWCRAVLRRHWPRVARFDDVRTFNRSSINGHVSIVAGGFPCQDISSAGKKAGITGARSGLWKEMLRVIQELAPPVALVENVSALRNRGLDVVLSDLAESGYDAEWDCLTAAAFGAPHRRDRLFIVAHAQRVGRLVLPVLDGVARPQPRPWLLAEHGRTVKAYGRRRRAYPRRLRVGTGSSAGVDRVRGAGNAVVPAVAEWIGRRIIAAAGPAMTERAGEGG